MCKTLTLHDVLLRNRRIFRHSLRATKISVSATHSLEVGEPKCLVVTDCELYERASISDHSASPVVKLVKKTYWKEFGPKR